MTNVVKTYFITKEEAVELNSAIDYYMPIYELEDGKVMYPHITGADIMTYHSYATLEEIEEYRRVIDEAWKNR